MAQLARKCPYIANKDLQLVVAYFEQSTKNVSSPRSSTYLNGPCASKFALFYLNLLTISCYAILRTQVVIVGTNTPSKVLTNVIGYREITKQDNNENERKSIQFVMQSDL